MAEVTLEVLAAELRSLREGQERLEAKIDAATGGGKVTLAFLAEQQLRVLDELGRLRDDLTVTAATVARLDGAVQGLTLEVHGEHARHDRPWRRDLDRIAGRAEHLEEPSAPS